MDGQVARLADRCTQYEATLAELEETLRNEIERTALLSAELRTTRDKLGIQIGQIEHITDKSLPAISDRLAHAQERALKARSQIPKFTKETEAAHASFENGHEKARRLATALRTHTAHWTTKLIRILRREAPPDRHTVAMAAVHAALFLAMLAVVRSVTTWVGWDILRRYVDAKRPHIHQLLNIEPRT
ncbi:transmembrane protein [Ceratobasidium sp. AG-Ba]|nr:transmembrane protein [Ceratobasidium sp. AG-Ba]